MNDFLCSEFFLLSLSIVTNKSKYEIAQTQELKLGVVLHLFIQRYRL